MSDKIISFARFRKTLKELNCNEKMLNKILQPVMSQRTIDRLIQQLYEPTEKQLESERLHDPKDL